MKFILLEIFQPFFTERVFQIFDKDNSGTISLQEFIDAMHQFSGQSSENKIKFLFKVYDIDGKNVKSLILVNYCARYKINDDMMFAYDNFAAK